MSLESLALCTPAAVALYAAAAHFGAPSGVLLACKALPALGVGVHLWLDGCWARAGLAARYQRAVCASALGCALGDVLLELDKLALCPAGAPCFLAGLAAFLCAHVLLTLGFRTQRAERGGTWPRAPAFGVAIYGYCALLFTQLLPSLHPDPVLVLGVGAYAIAIGTMLFSACAWQHSARSPIVDLEPPQLAVAGAALFVLSDSLLAWNRFVAPFPHAQRWILGTYFSATQLLGLSVRTANAPQRHRQVSYRLGVACAQAQGLFALNPRWAIAMGYTKAIHKGL